MRPVSYRGKLDGSKTAVPSTQTVSGVTARGRRQQVPMRLHHAATLTATWWPLSDDRLLIVEVARSQLPKLRPWFNRHVGVDTDIPWVPAVKVMAIGDNACLMLAGATIGSARASAEWRSGETCMVGVVARGLIDANPLTVAEQFLALLDVGQALIAEVPLCSS